MTKFTTTADIETRADAEKYLSGLGISSTIMLFNLQWVKMNDKEMFADTGTFSVLHNTEYRWWEIGFQKNGELMVERFYSMEEALAYIVLRWW